MDKMAMKLMTKCTTKRMSWAGMFVGLVMVSGCQNMPSSKILESPKAVMTVLDGDDDHDGVPNSIDQCPNTPKDTVVDSKGCPHAGMGTELNMFEIIFYANNHTAIPKHPIQLPSDNVTINAWQNLTKIAEKWHEHPNAFITIEGHASKFEGKSDTDRMQLSKLRASIVKYTLIHQFGVAPSKVFAVGYGANRPIKASKNSPEEIYNRRVYIWASENIHNTPYKKDKLNPFPRVREIAN